MSRNKRKEKKEFFISSYPSLVAPVSEVAKEKYFCPLLIWGWLRKRRNEWGREEGEEEREEWRDRRPEGGLLEDPLFLEAERKKKEGRKWRRNEKWPAEEKRRRLREGKRGERGRQAKRKDRNRQIDKHWGREGRKRNKVVRQRKDKETGR